MRILVATDAWHPQVNGVVRTLQTLASTAPRFGAEIEFLTHQGFALFRCRPIRRSVARSWRPGTIAKKIDAIKPDAIHIATEGTIGHAVRRYCIRRGIAFTTSFHTRLRRNMYRHARQSRKTGCGAGCAGFHGRAERVMVSTQSLISELSERGFRNPVLRPRGVDGDFFAPREALPLDLPRPIFLTVGRVAVEEEYRSLPLA